MNGKVSDVLHDKWIRTELGKERVSRPIGSLVKRGVGGDKGSGYENDRGREEGVRKIGNKVVTDGVRGGGEETLLSDLGLVREIYRL